MSGRVEYATGWFLYSANTHRPHEQSAGDHSKQRANSPPVLSPTPPTSGTVYLKAFSQVFALNQDAPTQNDTLNVYETDTVKAFPIPAHQGAFTHLLSQDGPLTFWALNDNLASTPPPLPRYDKTFAGRRVDFVSEQHFACETQYPPPFIFGLCADISNVADGDILQRAQVDSSILYEVRVTNNLYWVSAIGLRSEPH